ncbi:centromere protein M isoform X2 [Natator depressus]|uniref:centromere protein M isoform X2 n=1 Tax=Natator depressus TaxID=27790 RepID=UPI003EBA695F
MSLVRPFDKLPTLNSAAILLVGTDERRQQQLAEAILKEKKNFKINIHVATSLPLPAERDHVRPRINLIAFMINMQSKHSLRNVEASLSHIDANFFLGKVCFLITGVGRMNHCSVEMNAVRKLGNLYCSPVLFCELDDEKRKTCCRRATNGTGPEDRPQAGHRRGTPAVAAALHVQRKKHGRVLSAGAPAAAHPLGSSCAPQFGDH